MRRRWFKAVITFSKQKQVEKRRRLSLLVDKKTILKYVDTVNTLATQKAGHMNTANLHVKMKASDKETLKSAAEIADFSNLSEWARITMLREAKRIIKKQEKEGKQDAED